MKTKLIFLFITLLAVFSLASCITGNNPEQTKEKWIPIQTIDQLTGKWTDENGTLEFPKKLDGKDYLLLTEPETDDSTLWTAYAQKYGISVNEIWEKRFAATGQIYGQNYPLSDVNGTQKGIKFHEPIFYTRYTLYIHSHLETIIPEEIIYKNLPYFSISEDGKRLKTSGTFRFYSSRFKNFYTEERILTKDEIKE